MGQYLKYSFEMKLAAVTKYLGAKRLKITPKLSVYSAETKQNAAADYLADKGTFQ